MFGHGLRDSNSTLNEITGYEKSPESDDMSSLTTEHYGLIGLLVLLHGLCICFRLCQDECSDQVVIYVDNNTVVKRGNNEQQLMNISDYSVPDQDLWSLTTDIINALPIYI